MSSSRSNARSLMRLAILLALLLLLASCAKPPTTATLVLVDLSKSTESEGMRQDYEKDFKAQVLPSAKGGDWLAVDRIRDRSSSGSTFPIKFKVSRFSMATDNQNNYDRIVQQQQAEAVRDFKKLIKESFLGTDILSSLNTAERFFGRVETDQQRLVIFSDMQEFSERLKMDGTELTDDMIQKFIAREKEDGRFPDLSGADVYIVGMTSESQSYYYQIEKFWKTYFEASGANLVDSGRSLIKFP